MSTHTEIHLKQALAETERLMVENDRLRALLDEAATNPEGDYYTGLRCGVEDRDIYDRYDAAEYGWDQAFEYVASVAAGGSVSEPAKSSES